MLRVSFASSFLFPPVCHFQFFQAKGKLIKMNVEVNITSTTVNNVTSTAFTLLATVRIKPWGYLGGPCRNDRALFFAKHESLACVADPLCALGSTRAQNVNLAESAATLWPAAPPIVSNVLSPLNFTSIYADIPKPSESPGGWWHGHAAGRPGPHTWFCLCRPAWRACSIDSPPCVRPQRTCLSRPTARCRSRSAWTPWVCATCRWA